MILIIDFGNIINNKFGRCYNIFCLFVTTFFLQRVIIYQIIQKFEVCWQHCK